MSAAAERRVSPSISGPIEGAAGGGETIRQGMAGPVAPTRGSRWGARTADLLVPLLGGHVAVVEMRTVTGAAFTVRVPDSWASEWDGPRRLDLYDPANGWVGHVARVRAVAKAAPPTVRPGLRLRRVDEIELAHGASTVNEVVEVDGTRSWCALLRGPEGRLVEVVVMPLNDEGTDLEDAVDLLRDLALEVHVA